MSDNDDSGTGGGTPDLNPHPLVSKLHPEPNEHGSNATFTGYLGPSSKPDHHRVYLDTSFGTYVEVPKDAIVATRSAGDDDNAPTHVTVRADAQIRYVSVTSHTGSASYLSGGIASAHLAAGAPSISGEAPVCITVFTHSPTWCPRPFCATFVTANPTDCHGPCEAVAGAAPTGAPNNTCLLTIYTANVTACAPPHICPTYFTAVPSNCQHHPCLLTIVTANPSNCPGVGSGPVMCATFMTSNPTYCQHPPAGPCVSTTVTSNPSACV